MKTNNKQTKCKQNASKCKEIQTQKTNQNQPLPNKINENHKNQAKCKQNASKCKAIQTQKTKQNQPLPNKINENQ